MTDHALMLVNDSPGPLDAGNFETAMETAEKLSQSSLVPDDYKGKPQNVLVALESAHRLAVSPLVAMNSLHMIKGRPLWATTFQIGLVNSRAGLKQPLDWIVTPMDKKAGTFLSVTCYAICADGRRVEETVDWKRVSAEGWDSKPGSKYKTMPIIMMKYRAAAALIRQHWPHVMLGFYCDVEADDFADTRPDFTAPEDIIDEADTLPEPEDVIEGELVD